MLEGGQTKEDQKKDEIFFNTTLAPDEVDRLLFAKVFSNATKITVDGTNPVSVFSENDNLIIRGNNLLSLASVLRRFEEKIKCIYIDIKTPRLIQFNYSSADFAA